MQALPTDGGQAQLEKRAASQGLDSPSDAKRIKSAERVSSTSENGELPAPAWTVSVPEKVSKTFNSSQLDTEYLANHFHHIKARSPGGAKW